MNLDPRTIEGDPRLADESLKRRFAAMWVQKPDFPYLCIAEIIGTHTAYHRTLAIAAYQSWPKDEYVLAEVDRIKDQKGESALIPSRESIALEILELARKAKTEAGALRAYELFNVTMGYGPKFAGSHAPTVNVHANKVLVVKDKGDPEQWSAGLQQQQKKLQTEARAEIDALGSTKH